MEIVNTIRYNNVKYWTLITSLFSIAGSLAYFGYQVAKFAYYFGMVTSQHQTILDLLQKCINK